MRSLRLTVCVVVLLVLGCGGGGGGGGPTPVTVDLLSSPTQQLSVTAGPPFGSNLHCGDLDGTAIPGPFRALLTFDLSTLPAGVTVTGAVLKLRQATVDGAPYTDLGNIVVDHVDYGAGLPTQAHYTGGTLANDIGTLSTSDALVLKALDVTARVVDDLANTRTRSQFRVRFSPLDTDGDVNLDQANFETAADLYGTGEVPVLTVTYLP